MQKQIKITISEESMKVIDSKAKKLGMTRAGYCYNLIFEKIRKEEEQRETKSVSGVSKEKKSSEAVHSSEASSEALKQKENSEKIKSVVVKK